MSIRRVGRLWGDIGLVACVFAWGSRSLVAFGVPVGGASGSRSFGGFWEGILCVLTW